MRTYVNVPSLVIARKYSTHLVLAIFSYTAASVHFLDHPAAQGHLEHTIGQSPVE
jgi:hypothetical protein